jgi:hypothetical protein
VLINNVNIGDELIKGGFAVPYFGVGPRKNWCPIVPPVVKKKK